MLCLSPPALRIPGPAPQAFSQGQPGPSAALAVQPGLTALHPPPSAASIPCNQTPLLLLLPDSKFLEGKGLGLPLRATFRKSTFSFFLSPLFPSLSNF